MKDENKIKNYLTKTLIDHLEEITYNQQTVQWYCIIHLPNKIPQSWAIYYYIDPLPPSLVGLHICLPVWKHSTSVPASIYDHHVCLYWTNSRVSHATAYHKVDKCFYVHEDENRMQTLQHWGTEAPGVRGRHGNMDNVALAETELGNVTNNILLQGFFSCFFLLWDEHNFPKRKASPDNLLISVLFS